MKLSKSFQLVGLLMFLGYTIGMFITYPEQQTISIIGIIVSVIALLSFFYDIVKEVKEK